MKLRERLFKLLFRNEWEEFLNLKDIKNENNEMKIAFENSKREAWSLKEILRSYRKDAMPLNENLLPLAPFFTEDGKETFNLISDIICERDKRIDEVTKALTENENKYSELERALIKYMNRIKNGFLTLENPVFYAIELRDENGDFKEGWEVELGYCNLGGCTLSTVEFKTKELAEVFTVIYELLGNEVYTSTCHSCYAEYMEGCI